MNTAETILELQERIDGAKGVQIITQNNDLSPLLLHPNYMQLSDLSQYLNTPERIKTTITFAVPQSLAKYVNKYGDSDTLITADRLKMCISVVLDYHTCKEASWTSHTANYRPRQHLQYKTWDGAMGKAMGQADFARYLRSHITDIVSHQGAELLDLVSELRVVRNGGFASKVDVTRGGYSLSVTDERAVKAGVQSVDLPDSLTIAVPVFEHQEQRDHVVDLVVDVKDNDVSLTMQWRNREESISSAFEKDLDDFHDALGLPNDLGTLYV